MPERAHGTDPVRLSGDARALLRVMLTVGLWFVYLAAANPTYLLV